MNKKTLALLIGLVIIVGGLFAGGYYWWRPRVANEAIVKAADAYLEGRDNNDVAKYDTALRFLDKAIAWGQYDSTIGIFRGQVLVGLERFEEARLQYQQVLETDPSAKEAVTELLNQLPQ